MAAAATSDESESRLATESAASAAEEADEGGASPREDDAAEAGAGGGGEGGGARGGEGRKTKKDHPSASSYYKWSEDIKKREEETRRLGVSVTPVKLDCPVAPDIVRADSGSAWNAGGTWEDKDVSKSARTELKSAMKTFSKSLTLAGAPATLRVRKVKSCSGSATLVFSRGKVKPGFELKLTAEWEAVNEGGDVLANGEVEFPEIADYNGGDVEFNVTAEGSGDAVRAAKTALEKSSEQFVAIVAAWTETLKTLK